MEYRKHKVRVRPLSKIDARLRECFSFFNMSAVKLLFIAHKIILEGGFLIVAMVGNRHAKYCGYG
ncbi:MAG: hypothetical protein COA82_08180 [Alkaliphilus sp.]|nr:MAG: hypothetical protein COA82_08180 [Alkaliphilus sp.]